MTYVALTGLDVATATTNDVGDMWKQLAGCCEGRDNIYIARADCKGVACYTKDRAVVERWGSCVAEQRNNTKESAFGYRIDYGYLKDGKISGASSLATKSGLLIACLLGVSLILTT